MLTFCSPTECLSDIDSSRFEAESKFQLLCLIVTDVSVAVFTSFLFFIRRRRQQHKERTNRCRCSFSQQSIANDVHSRACTSLNVVLKCERVWNLAWWTNKTYMLYLFPFLAFSFCFCSLFNQHCTNIHRMHLAVDVFPSSVSLLRLFFKFRSDLFWLFACTFWNCRSFTRLFSFIS